ncbi:type 2 isopentenyl-diphosphate Delta-isomerase [Pseudomonas sp. MTM4]|uniref:type 2 isopentenyl-diphosphate Delta-isomerase n=1 Tax=unclassified Pseudomonas TaxID=196821 RepID=UPI0018D22F14|nr:MULTISPECIES: type 2 isopentenyl-diphosphate Delta-isomerase [unclassified Pseudomonas]MBC8649091.1 type 2 isopentenyl-diphosphate Delta-isomerase [Pseudomonas sp. MT4]QXY93049.1 type 2 isopentenyl-diphosphate Delta-isomerase [Pseudomonas sp. MTM4]
MSKDLFAERKNEHLDIVLDPRRACSKADTGFSALRFEHCAMPELCLNDIDIRSSLFGRDLAAPLLISSMTGGAARAAQINRNLAEAAEALGIALAVGSQRIALETGADQGLTRQLRQLAPSIPLLANFGAAQLVAGYGLDEAQRAVEMIEADALIIHFNPLQEAVQVGGDRNWRGVLSAIQALAARLTVPLVAKEVGAGISPSVAQRLLDAGVSVIDVAGAGGTSWAAVEAERTLDPQQRAIAQAFAGWGIPSAQAIASVRRACPDAHLIASGGIRDGIDVAKAIRLGADLVGQAAGVLDAALLGPQAVVEHFQVLIQQLRIACFCTGSADLAALLQAPLLPAFDPSSA